jgi:hypothetical protein
VHGRAERPQLLEDREGREVAGVEDQVGATQFVQTCLGENPDD